MHSRRACLRHCTATSRAIRRRALLLEPHVLEAPVVVDRVFLLDMALEVGMPASALLAVIDHRARHVLDQDALDLPDQLSALFLIELARLLIEERIYLRIAVLREV